MFILKIIMKTIKVIGSETSPVSIACAVVLGFILALNPLLSIQGLCCILLLTFCKVNIAASLFSLLIFSLMYFVSIGVLDSIGMSLLTSESLLGLWTFMYNSSISSLTIFYNSVALGGIICSLILVVPVFFGALAFVRYYRHSIEPKIRNSRLAQVVKASKLYKIYVTVTSPIGGGA